jgi:hypothetical protein
MQLDGLDETCALAVLNACTIIERAREINAA